MIFARENKFPSPIYLYIDIILIVVNIISRRHLIIVYKRSLSLALLLYNCIIEYIKQVLLTRLKQVFLTSDNFQMSPASDCNSMF